VTATPLGDDVIPVVVDADTGWIERATKFVKTLPAK
jgi:hypothetical protein